METFVDIEEITQHVLKVGLIAEVRPHRIPEHDFTCLKIDPKEKPVAIILIDRHKQFPEIENTSLDPRVPTLNSRKIVPRIHLAFTQEPGEKEGTVGVASIHHGF